jgi:hypothetical protein
VRAFGLVAPKLYFGFGHFRTVFSGHKVHGGVKVQFYFFSQRKDVMHAAECSTFAPKIIISEQ